jgi:hypothetical protein
MDEGPMSVPAYYLGTDGTPAWDAIETYLDGKYNLGCAFKYMVRAGKKSPDPREDLRKARRCIEREIELADARLGIEVVK